MSGSVLRANRKWCRMYSNFDKVFDDPQRPSNKEFKDFVQSYLIFFLKNPYAIFDYNKLSRESIKLQCLHVLRCFSREQNFILDLKKGDIFFHTYKNKRYKPLLRRFLICTLQCEYTSATLIQAVWRRYIISP